MSEFQSFAVNEDKLQNLVNLKITAKVSICDFCQNLKMTKSSYVCSIHQENICKPCLHSKLNILTDSHSFAVNEDKLKKLVNFQNSC